MSGEIINKIETPTKEQEACEKKREELEIANHEYMEYMEEMKDSLKQKKWSKKDEAEYKSELG